MWIWYFQLARKNMWRNPHRTVITLTAVFFAVVLSVLAGSLKEGIFNNLVKNLVSYYTGYIQVHQKGYWDERILDNSMATDNNQLLYIRQTDNVKAVAPRLESFALATSDSSTKGCLVIGIDPATENQVTHLQDKLIRGSYLSSSPTLLVAKGLAKRLNLDVDDTLYLIGQGYHAATAAGKYRIQGIVEFGSPELNQTVLFMPLPHAQELFGTGDRVTSWVVMLNNSDRLESTRSRIRSQLSSDYEVMTWGELMPEVKQHIETDSQNMVYVQYVLYLLVCFGIFGTFIMMMMERQYELGMLIAIGMKKYQLSLVMLMESVLTVLTGCVAGLLASIPVTWYFEKHPIRIGGETARAYERFGFEAVFPTSTDPHLFIQQGLTVLILSLMLSGYPIYKIYRINPVNVLKR